MNSKRQGAGGVNPPLSHSLNRSPNLPPSRSAQVQPKNLGMARKLYDPLTVSGHGKAQAGIDQYLIENPIRKRLGLPWFVLCVVRGRMIRSKSCIRHEGHEICVAMRREYLFEIGKGHTAKARGITKTAPRVKESSPREMRTKAKAKVFGDIDSFLDSNPTKAQIKEFKKSLLAS